LASRDEVDTSNLVEMPSAATLPPAPVLEPSHVFASEPLCATSAASCRIGHLAPCAGCCRAGAAPPLTAPGLPRDQATGRLCPKACGAEGEREDLSRGKNGENEWIAVKEGKKIKERKKEKKRKDER
jgi:hypothetical protein